MLDVLWTSCSDVVAAVTLRTSRVRIKTWGLNTNVVLCRHEDYFRTCHFFRKPHTSFLWQVGAQKVISSSCCWSKTHLLERVPSKSFKLQILVWFVDFIGTFLGALCRVWCRIPLRKKAKCKQRSWCHGVIQRLFQSVNGGDGKWDVVRGMWLVSLKTWKMFCWCSRFRKLPELNSLILIFALTERFALSSVLVCMTNYFSYPLCMFYQSGSGQRAAHMWLSSESYVGFHPPKFSKIPNLGDVIFIPISLDICWDVSPPVNEYDLKKGTHLQKNQYRVKGKRFGTTRTPRLVHQTDESGPRSWVREETTELQRSWASLICTIHLLKGKP